MQLQAFIVKFDYVIIDTPPLAGNASASILGKMSDGLLFVVRPGVTETVNVERSQDLIDRFHQNILGIVVNSTVDKYEPYSYFLSEEFYYRETASSVLEELEHQPDRALSEKR